MIAARRVRLLTGLFLIAFCATVCAATRGPAPIFVANGLGKGTVDLSGPWEFQTGDNPAWSSPGLNLNDPRVAGEWEQITAEKPWGAQGHPRLCRLCLVSAADPYYKRAGRRSGCGALHPAHGRCL